MNLAGVFLIALAAPDTGDAAGDALDAFRRIYRRRAGLDERIEGVQHLARHKDPRVAGLLASLLTREKLEVRIVVARSLAGFGGVEGVGRDLVVALRHPSNRRKSTRGVAVTLLKSMGSIGGREVVPEVNARFRDRDPWIAKAAIQSAGRLRSGSSVGLLVRALKHMEGPSGRHTLPEGPLASELPPTTLWAVIRDAGPTGKDGKPAPTRHDLLAEPIRRALTSITREEYSSADGWSDWWRRNQRTFKVPK